LPSGQRRGPLFTPWRGLLAGRNRISPPSRPEFPRHPRVVDRTVRGGRKQLAVAARVASVLLPSSHRASLALGPYAIARAPGTRQQRRPAWPLGVWNYFWRHRVVVLVSSQRGSRNALSQLRLVQLLKCCLGLLAAGNGERYLFMVAAGGSGGQAGWRWRLSWCAEAVQLASHAHVGSRYRGRCRRPGRGARYRLRRVV